MKTSDELIESIGLPLSGETAKVIIKNFRESFRKPFVKSNPETHGPTWTQFKGNVAWTDTGIFGGLPFSECFLLWDERKNTLVFKTNTSSVLNYLNSRSGRSYPPIYVFNDELTFSICQNGDDNLVRPVKLVKADLSS